MDPVILERIERIQDVVLPPEAEEVFDNLSEEGAARFGRELFQALLRAQGRSDLRPVLDVVEAWYRTLLMRQHPDYEDMVRWARHGGSGETYPAEKVVARFSG